MMKKFLTIGLIIGVLTGCSQDGTLSDKEVEKYTKQGKEIVQASFKELSSKLKVSLQSGGTKEAIGFCNVSALPLTQQLSKKYQAKIKRTSLQLRNPKNAPDSLEAKMLDMYLIMSRMRNPIMVPKLIATSETEIQFYAPIMIKNETCLKCHGTLGKEISNEDYALINQFYPNDKAIGYSQGKLRGMWSITFKK